MQERFIEGVTNDRGRLDHDGNECNSTDQAGQDKIAVGY